MSVLFGLKGGKMILSGKRVKVEFTNGGVGKGILIDFYPSANEGIYGVVMMDNGEIKEAHVSYITVLTEPKTPL